MRRSPRLLALGLVLLAACDGGQPPTQAGDLLVSYYGGGAEAGAILLTITGGPVQTVSPVGAQQVSFSTPLAGTTKVIVSGTLGTGDVLRLRVPDLEQSASYRVTVVQVADNTTFALIDPSQHTFTIHR